MKKLLCILLTMAMLLSLTACGSGDSAAPDKKDEKAGLTYPYNLVNRPMKVNDVYDYKTTCYTDPSVETNGHIYIYDYIVEPAEDGMVDKTVKAMFVFDDDNAWNYGMSFDLLYADFANDTVYGGEEDWTVPVDGKDYPVTVLQDEFISGEWTPMSNFVSKYVLTIRMPEGYDDIGLFFYNSAHKDNVRDEDGNIPDGTPLTSLIDSHSQWFVLGGKGADWEETKTPTYYGQSIEAQVNNIAIEDVLGGTPVFDVPDDVDEDGAPPEDMMEDFPRIEIVGWSEDVLKRDGITEVKIDFDIYNAPAGSCFEATAYTDAPKASVERDYAYSDSGVLRWSVTLEVDGSEATSDSATFEIAVYDADDYLIDVSRFDIPFDKPYDGADTPVIPEDDDTVYEDVDIEDYTYVEFTDWSHDSIPKGKDTELDVYRNTHNWFEGDTLTVNVYTDGNNTILFAEHPVTSDDHSFSVMLESDKLTGDNLYIELALKDSEGNEISFTELCLPIE